MTASRLLMIDDQPDMGALVRSVAEGLEYEMRFVTRADAFIAAHRSFDPDIVILDLSMPGTDGIELMKVLAHEKSRARVVIMSGLDAGIRDGAGLLGEGRGLDIAAIVSKPVRVAELQSILGGLRTKTK